MVINFLLLLTVAFWGLSFIGTKMALEYLTPGEIITIRLLLSLPVLFIIMKARRFRFEFHKDDFNLMILASFIIGFHFVVQAYGLTYTSATNTSWLIATVPIFIAIASRLFLKEKLSAFKVLGISIATIGVMLLISKGALDNIGWIDSIGDWIILVTCISWTAYTIMTKGILKKYKPLTVITALLILPTVSLCIYTGYTTPMSKILNLPLEIILVLIALGVLCAGLAQWIWLEAVAKKGAVKSGVFLYFEPVVTTVAAIPILGESLNWAGYLGAVLILAGVYLVERQNRKQAGE